MADKEPLLFKSVLGALRPITEAAQAAVKACNGQIIRSDIKRTTGNTKRLALYWVCLRKATEQLSDAVDGILSTKALHRRLKRESGLATPIVSKRTGEIIDYDYESMSFESMPENERADHIDWCLNRMSEWIGCDVTELTDEAERDAA